MSYATTFSQRSIIYSRIREQSLSKQNHSRKVIISLLICVIILFSVLYIVQVNGITAGGYKIQKYKSEISRVQSDNKNLELKLSEVRSLSFLEEKVKSLNMVKTAKVEYISPISEVAAK